MLCKNKINREKNKRGKRRGETFNKKKKEICEQFFP
jgi:hypothetical protein